MSMVANSAGADPAQVLLTGAYEHPEFVEPIAWLDRHCRVVRRPIQQATSWLGLATGSPSAIVVAKSRPGQFSGQQIQQLQRAAPLAHVVALLSSWCESEPLSGQPWPGVRRVFWHQAIVRFAQQFTPLADGPQADWALPRTSTSEERLLHWASHRRGQRAFQVAISSHDGLATDWLVDACRAVGFSARAISAIQDSSSSEFADVAAIVWHTSSRDPNWIDNLRVAVDKVRPVPVIVLIDFLRHFEQVEATRGGAAAAISMPCLLSDLAWHLDRAAPTLASVNRKSPAA